MGVDFFEVFGPVAVIAAVALLRVPPFVCNRRGDPDGGCPEPLDVVEVTADAGEIAAAVARTVRGVVLVRALAIVAGVAVLEAVDHQEIGDLVAPVRGRGMQAQVGGRRHLLGPNAHWPTERRHAQQEAPAGLAQDGVSR